MKSLLFIATFLVAFCGSAFAQQTATTFEADARNITTQLTAKYGLNEGQAARMQKIQLRKFKNTASIELLKASDTELYYKKIKSLQKGTLNSIKMLLNTTQQEVFQKTQADIRQQKAAKRKQLLQQGVAAKEIDHLLLDIYAE